MHAEALVKQPVRLVAVHRGETLFDGVFQHTPIRIGRLVDNDVTLPFDFISRHHCELRFAHGIWVAADLGSKNGLIDPTNMRVDELVINDGDTFRIQDLSVHISYAEAPAHDFQAMREAKTVIGSYDASPPPASEVGSWDDRQRQISQASFDVDGKRPLLDANLREILLEPHAMIGSAKKRAVQTVVQWHDQVLDVRELHPGSPVTIELLGESMNLGRVKSDKTKIKIPKGCTPLTGDDPKIMILTPDSPVAFRVDQSVTVTFRYVPRSKGLAGNTGWVEEKLVDPLLLSSAVHGVAAMAAILTAKPQPKTTEEPERFATIIVAPTPAPLAMQPTPTPTPNPTPSPTPMIAKKVEEKIKEKPKPPPPEKKIVAVKKVRKLAQMRKEEVAPPKAKVEMKVAAKDPEPPVKIDPEPQTPPAPAPTPVFEAKKVGALKMLSALNAGPASEIANVEKIQISRAPSNVSGSLVGREAINGTREIESKLNQSAKGGGNGRGDGIAGVAVGGTGAGGSYKLAGLAGKAGNRKIRGTVVGGATYSELKKNEGLSRAQVMKVVQEHQGEIQACYERALMSNPDLVGRAEFEWEISPQGSVSGVKTKEATLKNGETLLDCVKGVFARMKFPAAKNGESTAPTIGLPFGRL